ncbi:unnamed protein product [Bursaphelenchus okinawaensis]|uniref:acid phosphatase n=1 Tax=Bursaphelenchus okinawaensis TaxID=465554 RepID=A0A811LNT7_9BILA|nr:unnamed protein product [Bursaphelenchus okinawaensis]CAG9127228.1 unnamed protein product [Bursaphelenchus okinawaensis]
MPRTGLLTITTVLSTTLILSLPIAPPAEERGLGPDGHPDDKLVLVEAIWRHGDRSPLFIYPTSLNLEADWPAPIGFLTPLGVEQQNALGQWIRRRYVEHFKFLPDQFQGDILRVRSTQVNRTIKSAHANLFGMYGAPTVEYPIDVVPMAEDYAALPTSSCQRLISLRELIKATPEYALIETQHQDLYHKLLHLTGYAQMDTEKIPHIWDPMYLEKLHNLEINPKLDELYDEIDQVYNNFTMLTFGYNLDQLNDLDLSLELRKVWGGTLLDRIIREMQVKIECNQLSSDEKCIDNIKYYAQSAHEVTLAAVMSTFGFELMDYDRMNLPDLCSSMFLELWQNAQDDSYYVKVIYRRNATDIFDVTPKISNCKMQEGRGCEFNSFMERSSDYLPTTDYKTVCNTAVSI